MSLAVLCIFDKILDAELNLNIPVTLIFKPVFKTTLVVLRFIETAAVVSIEANVRNTLMVSRLGGPHNLASCSKSTRRCAKSNAQKRLWSVVCHYCYLCIKD